MTTRHVTFIACLLLWAVTATAQVPTGVIAGRVTDPDRRGVGGVRVSATSASLPGLRVTTTGVSGDYVLPLLPPGNYILVFELTGFQTVERSVSVAPTEPASVDAALAIGTVTEQISVLADARPFLETATVATAFRQELIAALPSNRTLVASVLMAPNVKATGPGGAPGGDGVLTLAGAPSFESVYMLNGVTITENLRGQPFTLFIEDAIQETTVSTGGISSEYGRFSGGIVNAITKSGGDIFSGSWRVSLNNDDWRAVTPFGETTLDKTIPTHEYTFGGPVFRDRLWFFTAGRLRDEEQARQTAVTNISFVRGDDERRYEGKLTYGLPGSRSIRGGYTRIRQQITNTFFQNAMDVRSLFDQGQPQDLLSLHYTGPLGAFWTEAQFSRRTAVITGAGAKSRDLIDGTLLIDRSRGTAFRYWSPTFCGVCSDEHRDNDEIVVKSTYFRPTARRGSHTAVFGYSTYNDHRLVNNYQSGSDYRILGTSTIVRGETIYPVFLGNDSTIIQWNPIAQASDGTDLRTHAIFANDSWRVSSGLTVNLGLRWDRNQGEDAAGNVVSTSAALSHRLGAAWDLTGDGRWVLTASTGRYVSALNASIAETSPAGAAAEYQWFYRGPSINADQSAPLMESPAAIQRVFDWFTANEGTRQPFVSALVPGVNTLVRESLDSPSALEYAAGLGRTLGARGAVRFDWMFRDYGNLYALRTDLTTGRVSNALGTVFDVGLVENSDELERRYQGATVSAAYRVGRTLDIGGNYTLSRTWGNFDGESPASLLRGQLGSYPEYRQARWNLPEGDLAADQRHRTRVWANYLLPLPERAGDVSVAMLFSAASGVPFGAAGAGTAVGAINPRPFVSNPGYATPLGSSATIDYFFFPRDQYRTQAQQRTDLAINYSRNVVGALQVFFHGEVLNVLNQFQLCGCGGTVFHNGGGSDIRTINASVLTASTSPALRTFNPFSEIPQEGVHWALGPTFGQPVSRFAYTTPRAFRFSVGVRF
jgi:hypothetical protein